MANASVFNSVGRRVGIGGEVIWEDVERRIWNVGSRVERKNRRQKRKLKVFEVLDSFSKDFLVWSQVVDDWSDFYYDICFSLNIPQINATVTISANIKLKDSKNYFSIPKTVKLLGMGQILLLSLGITSLNPEAQTSPCRGASEGGITFSTTCAKKII